MRFTAEATRARMILETDSMQITIATSTPQLGYALAADLETRGFHGVMVNTCPVKTYSLHHGQAVPAAEVARLLDALKPLQPETIVRDEEIDPDQIRLNLGDEKPLSAWECRIQTDSPGMLEKVRDLLDNMGYRDLGNELGLQEKNSLVYGGATPFARHVIRWQMRNLGIKIEESRHEEWEDEDDDLILSISDPTLVGMSPQQRFEVEVFTDEIQAGDLLSERLQSAGFRVRPVQILRENNALQSLLNIVPGPFGNELASGELARLRVLVSDLLNEQGIDQTRYPLKVGGESKGLTAVVTLPLEVCRAGRRRAYDGPFPERFNIKIYSDDPPAVMGLTQKLVDGGFCHPEVVTMGSLLDDGSSDSKPPEKGFFLVYGAAGKQTDIIRKLQDLVLEEMTACGAASSFHLNQSGRFHDDDPDIWIYFPVKGVADGTLLKKLAEPGRFRLKVYCPEPDEWADIIALLEKQGFAACEAVSRSGTKPSIEYGAAPNPLIDSLRDLILAQVGLTVSPRKIWNDSDEDIWIYLPNRPARTDSSVTGESGQSLDLQSWLQPLHPGVQPFLGVSTQQVRVGHVTLPRRRFAPGTPGESFVPELSNFNHFCIDPLTAETLQHVITSVALREPCLLEGETSTSKTSSILYLAGLLNQPVVRINLNGQTDTGELIGRFVPDAEEDDSPSEADRSPVSATRSFWRWQDGLVVQAMKNGWWVLLDEVNLAEPQILERLNSVLERDPSLVLTEFDNSTLGTRNHPVHHEFRIFATMNPAEYVGRSVLSPAYRDRWRGYRFVSRPDENDYLAMLRFLVFGVQPQVTVLGQPYSSQPASETPPHAALADWPMIVPLLAALARFHVALERASGPGEAGATRLGTRRKERYVFTRRGLLSILQYLSSPLVFGGAPPTTRVIREALIRYYIGRVSAKEDQALVIQLLDAAGIGPNTWSIDG